MRYANASVRTDDATAGLIYVREHINIKPTIVAGGKLDQVEYGKHRTVLPRPGTIMDTVPDGPRLTDHEFKK